MEVLFRKTEVGWRVLSFLLVAVMAFLLLAYVSPARGAVLTGWVLVPILAFILLIALLFGSITVSITRDWVRLKLGVGLIRRTEPRDRIVHVHTIPNPWYGFLVPGIRLVKRGFWYHIAGSQAVEFLLGEGRILRVSSGRAREIMTALGQAGYPVDENGVS